MFVTSVSLFDCFPVNLYCCESLILSQVLAEEAATASAAEPTTEEETNKEQLGDGGG